MSTFNGHLRSSPELWYLEFTEHLPVLLVVYTKFRLNFNKSKILPNVLQSLNLIITIKIFQVFSQKASVLVGSCGTAVSDRSE